MPTAQRQSYKSPAQAHVANGTLTFRGFVPPTGPNGLRNVIDYLEPVYDFSDLTIATAAVEGEDVWRAFERIVVEQANGVERVNLRGDELRVYDYDVLGAGAVPEYADIAVAANQALVFSVPVPLWKPLTKRPSDWSMPAELFNEMRITCCKTAAGEGLSVGTAVATIAGATVYVIAHCHEEDSVELKMVDRVRADSFPALTGFTLTPNGRVHGLTLFARGAAGGTALTSSFTDIQIDGLIPQALKRSPDLLQPFLRSRKAQNADGGTDGGAVWACPYAASKAVPVIFADEDTSTFDAPHSEQLLLRTNMSQTGMLAITRTVLPESEELRNTVARKHKFSPSEYRGKVISKGKSNRDRMAQSAYITKSGPLRRRGLAR